MRPIIKVENLGKRYRIGGTDAAYSTFRESFVEMARAPLKRLRRGRDTGERSIWALKDLSFEVKPGEVVGIIGRNGAGKSTLLKILSRITEPTEGCVKLYGRVGSLLEVGTGFHPELTGRENVYLNGAIIGMKRADIDKHFDAIVEFAGVSKFIDTPVKRYSSGMYLRLAFAVAAHLEPEILLIDEVLAVGDAEFQKKCLGKMQEVSVEGRTVLFVSHNMPAVVSLCPRAILLQEGAVAVDGPSHDIVGKYLSGGYGSLAERVWTESDEPPGNEIVRLRAARVRDREGQVQEYFDIRKPVGIEIEYDVLEPGHSLVPNFHFYTELGVLAFVATDHDPEWKGVPRPRGRFVSTAWIPGNFLAEGQMNVGIAISTMKPKRVHLFERLALGFSVVDSVDADTARGDFAGSMPGVVRPLLEWTTQFSSK